MRSPCRATIWPKAPVVHGVDGGHAVARSEHPVEGRRCASALHVAEDRDARLEARAVLYLLGEKVRDASEAPVAVDVDLALGRPRCVPGLGMAPSATTTTEAQRPELWRLTKEAQISSMSKGSSGMMISAAPPAMPA